MKCEKCDAEAVKLFELDFPNGESFMVCQKCINYYEVMADMEYERQKEEQYDNEDTRGNK